MKTPIYDFVREYASSDLLRMHMPGHKGEGVLGVEKLDITEIEGADVLYSANGIIEQSQNNASRLFGSERTLYSTEGSSLCIRAMLYLALRYARELGRKPYILVARNVHRSFMYAAGVLNIDVDWIYPSQEGTLLSCAIDTDELDKKLSELTELPIALYITSPDYLGNVADVRAIAEVCHRHGVLLMVDNAHGAYLKFLPEDIHPLSLGADICCDSAHKTLPALTGGAYLHISYGAPRFFVENAMSAMSVFASTSPSYLILQSLDRLNKYLAEGYAERLAEFIKKLENLKAELLKYGFSLIGDEPMKLCIMPKSYGYTGIELARYLAGRGIVCEFYDKDHLVMMPTPECDDAALARINRALLALEKRDAIVESAPIPTVAHKLLPIGEAMLSPSVELEVSECEGRVLADAQISCPPAIPIVVCGERIDSEAIKCFRYYGIERCKVIKE